MTTAERDALIGRLERLGYRILKERRGRRSYVSLKKYRDAPSYSGCSWTNVSISGVSEYGESTARHHLLDGLLRLADAVRGRGE